MADDLQYSSARTESKRKYEEQTTPPPPPPASSGPRRPTGFSAPITSQSPDSNPPPCYNSVPPPMDEIQLAKQRAQEIAARLFSNAEAKRPRLENGGPNDDPNDTKGFSSSAPSDLGQKALGQQLGQGGMGASSMPAAAAGYGFQGTSKKIEIPNGRVGVIIGKSGETIKYLQVQSGAKIQVTRDVDADLTSATRMVELMGTPEQISKAEQLINGVIAQAEAGGSNPVSRRFSGQTGGEQFQMKVPNNKVGLIIGKGGETIKNMQATSGARIQLIPLHLPPGDLSTERTVYIDGTNEQIEAAKQLVNEVISENRLRNPAISGGYNQQGHRPPQPPSWGPPGPPPMQQTSYGYMQPGAYPGPPPQYNNMSQPPYAGYPPQPTSSGWDQTGVPPSQQTTQGSGYDYYSQQTTLQQQAPHGGTSTNAGYNYNKPPAASYNQQQGSFGGFTYSQAAGGPQQSYPQDGYGGGFHTSASQPGYGQPQTNVQPGYDQSQGYNAAPSYGTGVSPAQDSAATAYGVQGGSSQIPPSQQVPPSIQAPPAAQQVYTSQQPNTPPSYTAQAGYPPTSQPGYGSQPPAQTGYGQSLPLTQPGYDQPQGQKPPGQAAYGQTQPPSSQGGYIQPSSVQPGYAHSQSLPTQSPAAQPDSSHHRPPPSGFGSGAPQAGYAQQPYGVPPAAAQPGYSQQQQQPYGDSYGGGYSQPPVYSNDINVSGSAHGSYEAAAGAQPVQQSAVAKASPQS